MRNGKIALISLLAMVGIVWWHCYCQSAVECWFIPVFCVWAVPWFFVVSGFLFAGSVRRHGSLGSLKGKVKSLLLPYFMWCLIGVAISWPIVNFSGWDEVFAASLYLTHPIGNRALWYMRTLMVFMVVGGILQVLTNRLGRYSCVCFFVFFLVMIKMLVHGGIALGPGSSPFYFAVGVVLGRVEDVDCNMLRTVQRWIVFCGALGLALAIRVWWFALGYDFSNPGGTFLANVSTVFFIIGLWSGVGLLSERIFALPLVTEVCSLTAFVYFMHYPINDVVKHLFGGFNRNVVFMGLVLFAPILYLAIAFCIKRWVRSLYNILSGGR